MNLPICAARICFADSQMNGGKLRIKGADIASDKLVDSCKASSTFRFRNINKSSEGEKHSIPRISLVASTRQSKHITPRAIQLENICWCNPIPSNSVVLSSAKISVYQFHPIFIHHLFPQAPRLQKDLRSHSFSCRRRR